MFNVGQAIVSEAVKASETGQFGGLTITTVSGGLLVFIEGHPVLISAIGMLLGLTVQTIAIILSRMERRRRAREKIIEELKRKADQQGVTIDELLKDGDR